MKLSNITNFLSDKDKVLLSKKRIIIKGVAFYIKSLIIITIILLAIIFFLNVFKIDTSSLFSPLKADIKELQEKGTLYAIFTVALLAPFIEEIAFRLGLSFKRNALAISIGVLVYILLSFVTGKSYFEQIWIKLPVSLLVGFAVYRIPQWFWDNIKNKHGKLIIWCFTLLFAFLHINNYTIDADIIPMYFLMCLPQLIMGITLVYFRLNLGFFYAVAFHSLLNAFSSIAYI